MSREAGFTAIEMMFAVAIIMTVGGVAVPQVLAALNDYRAIGAARYVATRLQRARMEAVHRSVEVAVRFTQTPAGYVFGVFVDGNANGVLSRDIAAGVDWPLGAIERLADTFSGVDFGTDAGLPAVDTGGTPPGADPIRLGAGDLASFSPIGTSSSGSLYIRSRTRQLVVRIYGDTGKTRVLTFERNTGQWKPL